MQRKSFKTLERRDWMRWCEKWTGLKETWTKGLLKINMKGESDWRIQPKISGEGTSGRSNNQMDVQVVCIGSPLFGVTCSRTLNMGTQGFLTDFVEEGFLTRLGEVWNGVSTDTKNGNRSYVKRQVIENRRLECSVLDRFNALFTIVLAYHLTHVYRSLWNCWEELNRINETLREVFFT